MRASHDLAQLFIIMSVVISHIAFLTSCASNSAPISVAPILPGQSVPTVEQSPPPPPPYIPYESYAGEAENVQKVLDSIRENRHNDAPRSKPGNFSSTYPDNEIDHGSTAGTPSTSPSRFPHQIGYPATLTIMNGAVCKLGFYLKGPTSRKFGIDSGKSVSLDIAAGSYVFAVDTNLCDSKVGGKTYKVPPLLGNDDFEAGSSYTLALSQEDIAPKTGNFVIENNTGAKLTISVGGVTHTVASGSSSIELPEGSYTAMVSAKCGETDDNFDITKGETYIGHYWCTGGEIITHLPEKGFFDVNNNSNTGETLTIKVDGKTYKVRPRSSTTIELLVGSYKVRITSSSCGSIDEDIVIEGGSRYTGQYSCVFK